MSSMPEANHPIWRIVAFGMLCILIFFANYSLAESFSKDDWLRIISQISGALAIEGGLKASKSMFAWKKTEDD